MKSNEIYDLFIRISGKVGTCFMCKNSVVDYICERGSTRLQMYTACPTEQLRELYKGSKVTLDKDTRFFVQTPEIKLEFYNIGELEYEDFTEKVLNEGVSALSMMLESKGRYFDPYNGLEAVKKKQIIFNNGHIDTGVYNKLLYFNCLRLYFDYRFVPDAGVSSYLNRYAKKLSPAEKGVLAEMINSRIAQNGGAWAAVAEITKYDGLFEGFDSTMSKRLSELGDKLSAEEKHAYIWLLLILLNVERENIQKLMEKDNARRFYTDVKQSLHTDLCDRKCYMELQKKHGDAFMELLIGIQSVLAYLKGTEYKMPSKTVDIVSMIMSDDSKWRTDKNEVTATSEKPKRSTDKLKKAEAPVVKKADTVAAPADKDVDISQLLAQIKGENDGIQYQDDEDYGDFGDDIEIVEGEETEGVWEDDATESETAGAEEEIVYHPPTGLSIEPDSSKNKVMLDDEPEEAPPSQNGKSKLKAALDEYEANESDSCKVLVQKHESEEDRLNAVSGLRTQSSNFLKGDELDG